MPSSIALLWGLVVAAVSTIAVLTALSYQALSSVVL